MTPGTFAPATGDVRTYPIIPSPINADWTHTVPPRIRAQLIGGRATLTTGALGLPRQVQLVFTSSARIIARSANYFPQTPSRVENYSITPGSDQASPTAAFDIFLHFPPRILLQPADVISVVTLNKRIADTWSNVVLRFIEWIEP